MVCSGERTWLSTPENSDSDESPYRTSDEEEDEQVDHEGTGRITAPRRRRRPVPQWVPASFKQNPEGNTPVFMGGSCFEVSPYTVNTPVRSIPDSDVVRTLQSSPVGVWVEASLDTMDQASSARARGMDRPVPRAEEDQNLPVGVWAEADFDTMGEASSARARGMDHLEPITRAEDTSNIRPMSTEHPDRIALREMLQEVVDSTLNPYSGLITFTPSQANQMSRSNAAFHYRMGGRRSETLRARLERPRTPSPGEQDEQANRPYPLRTRRRRGDRGVPFVASPGKRRRLANDGELGRTNSIQRSAKWMSSAEERTAGSGTGTSLSVRSVNDKTLIRGLDVRHLSDESTSLAGYPPKQPKKEPKLVYSIVFLSQCLPRSFSHTKRVELLRVMTGNPKASAPFVPACVTYNIHQGSRKKGLLRVAQSFKSFFAPGTGIKKWIAPLDCGLLHIVRADMNPFSANPRAVMPKHPSDVAPFLGPSGRGWPAGQLPLEIFSKVASYLPRDAILNMRLVNHEFERNLAHAAFGTVVVAFRPEIYGMMVLDSDRAKKSKSKGKGKARATEPDCDDISHAPYTDYCGEVNSKAICDGMKVFESLGAQMKKFAMTFEVDERKYSPIMPLFISFDAATTRTPVKLTSKVFRMGLPRRRIYCFIDL